MSILSLSTGIYARIRAALHHLTWLPPLLSRVTVGWVMAQSGWGKLHHLPDVVSFFRDLHIPYPEIQAPFAAGCECICGVLLLLGLLTRIASIPLMVIMVVALMTAKRGDIHGFDDLTGMSEYLYSVILVWLLVYGGGLVSLDRLLKRMWLKDTSTPHAAT